MVIDYNQQKVFTRTLQLDDIGNTNLRCSTDDGLEYYISTRTIFGKTSILKFGPIIADIPNLPNNFMLFHKKIDYKEALIMKELNLLINDTKKSITNVEIISEDEALVAIPIFTEFFKDREELMLDEL